MKLLNSFLILSLLFTSPNLLFAKTEVEMLQEEKEMDKFKADLLKGFLAASIVATAGYKLSRLNSLQDTGLDVGVATATLFGMVSCFFEGKKANAIRGMGLSCLTFAPIAAFANSQYFLGRLDAQNKITDGLCANMPLIKDVAERVLQNPAMRGSFSGLAGIGFYKAFHKYVDRFNEAVSEKAKYAYDNYVPSF